MTYIEDYLEYLCNEKLSSLQSTDTIYFSIYKQTVRGLGLTDRQYALVLKKIQEYTPVEDLPTKIPLRTIDRSKYIKLVDTADVYGPDTVHESYKSNWKWIKVRFPFSKKDIIKIDSIQISHTEYFHKKGSHEHFYKFTPKNVFAVLSTLDNRNFEIEESLVQYYKKVQKITNESFDVFDYCLPKEVKNNIIQKTLLQIADKGHRYGYTVKKDVCNNVEEMIAYRKEPEVCIDPNEYKFDTIVNALYNLERFPLIVLIDEDMSYNQLSNIHKEITQYIPNEKQSVLFRVDNKDAANARVNDYIKEHNLNNWVDKQTKVVYIKKNKLPKVLLQSEFAPICAISKTSNRVNSNLRVYIDLFCDCIVYHDKSFSLFRKV